MQQTACEVSVSFGSFAMGIDRRAAATVEQLVRGDASVLEVIRSPYGVEGEYRLCIRVRSEAAAAQLVERLKRALGPVSAPVSITGPQGTFSATITRAH